MKNETQRRNTVGPYQTLPAGTRVQVNGYRGTVLDYEVTAPALVVVHRVTLTEHYTNAAGNQRRWEQIVPRIWQGNYSFLILLEPR